MGDNVNGDGEADLSAIIMNGWMKVRFYFSFMTSRAPPIDMICRVNVS